MSKFIMSCTTCALRGNGDEVADTFRYAPAAGYKYWGTAGPALWTPYIGRWLDAAKMKSEAARAGLKGCTEVYCPQICTDSEAAAVKSVDAIVAQAEFAVRLGSPLLVFSGGRREDGSAGLAATVAGLKALLPQIADMPIRVAIEPHFHSRFQDQADYDFIFSRVDHPQLGITVDTGHFHSAKVDTKALIRQYARKIWNVHLKDHVGTQSVNIGEGEIDLKGIFAELRGIGYEGALALEIEPEDTTQLPKFVQQSYTYITGLLKQLNIPFE
jgi:inosose dehydratase